mmetsp:Transcript_50629/g.89973  ORF Transcript_50629/g.89973 Transcript_50629/m.89973 type:complete len:152 (-) Transcript_50629:14-469(-)
MYKLALVMAILVHSLRGSRLQTPRERTDSTVQTISGTISNPMASVAVLLLALKSPAVAWQGADHGQNRTLSKLNRNRARSHRGALMSASNGQDPDGTDSSEDLRRGSFKRTAEEPQMNMDRKRDAFSSLQAWARLRRMGWSRLKRNCFQFF